MDKTVELIAKDGVESEAKIRKKEAGNPKYSFMNAGDPHFEYYQQKIKDLRDSKGMYILILLNFIHLYLNLALM